MSPQLALCPGGSICVQQLRPPGGPSESDVWAAAAPQMPGTPSHLFPAPGPSVTPFLSCPPALLPGAAQVGVCAVALYR